MAAAMYRQMAPSVYHYAFAFVDYEDRRDAEDALRYENGRTICGSNIIVEWAKGTPRVGGGRGDPYDECYKCHRPGHMARDCPGDRSYARAAPPRGRFRESRSRSRERFRGRSRSPRDRFR